MIGTTRANRLEEVLRDGEFAITAELSPPDSANPQDVVARARLLDGWVDAINATDGSGANCHMSSVAVCAVLAQAGFNTVMQLTCRDRNRIALQGDVLGAAALGVVNVLCLTGDGVQAGDRPQAKPVFDLDSVNLLSLLKTMRDDARFESGRPLSEPPRLFLGAAANPFAPPLDFRPHRLAKKVNAGAQFVQTQYCFDIDQLTEYMRAVRDMGVHKRVAILAGVGPLRSAGAAQRMRARVPGVVIPDRIIARLTAAADPAEEGLAICTELIAKIREIEGIAGIHVMAFRQEEAVGRIVNDSGVLRGRKNPPRAVFS